MVLKKDKQKVIDEVWTEDRVRDFIKVEPAENVEADYHMLLKAYQSMRDDDFEIFVKMFVAEGRDINAKGPEGRTVLSFVREHGKSAAYAKVLEANGGQ